MALSPETILIALFCTSSRQALSASVHGDQAGVENSKCGLTYCLYSLMKTWRSRKWNDLPICDSTVCAALAAALHWLPGLRFLLILTPTSFSSSVKSIQWNNTFVSNCFRIVLRQFLPEFHLMQFWYQVMRSFFGKPRQDYGSKIRIGLKARFYTRNMDISDPELLKWLEIWNPPVPVNFTVDLHTRATNFTGRLWKFRL